VVDFMVSLALVGLWLSWLARLRGVR